jgi:Uma2 family endonuclease
MTQLAEPHTMLWTRELYTAATESGIFGDRRLELIEGEIIEMSPMSSKHGMVIYLVQKVLERVFLDGYLVVAQTPLDLGEASEPQPDICRLRWLGLRLPRLKANRRAAGSGGCG